MSTKLEHNPWVSFWVNPRKVVREIVSKKPNYGLGILSGLYGLPIMWNFASSLSLGEKWPLYAILLFSLLFSFIAGFISISVFSAFVTWTGRWIGCKAPYSHVRAAVAWPNVTALVTVVSWIIWISFFPQEVFSSDPAQQPYMGLHKGLVLGTGIAGIIASIWGFILLLQAVGEVQNTSAWKALLNVIIAGVFLAVIVWILSWVAGWALMETAVT